MDTPTETALTPFQQQMMEIAQQGVEAEKSPGFTAISIRNSKFRVDDLALPNPLRVVILNAAFENNFYEGKFDQKATAAPICTALGYDSEALAPPADLKTKVQDVCGEPGEPGCCPNNEWASADTGRGKACKNGRKLAVILADEKNYAKATVYVLHVPPKSLSNVTKYIKNLGKVMHLPTFGVITALSFDEDEEYPLVELTAVAPFDMEQDQDRLSALMSLHHKTKAELVRPFVRKEEEAKPAEGKKKAAKY